MCFARPYTDKVAKGLFMYTAIFKEYRPTEWDDYQIVPTFDFEIEKDGVINFFSGDGLVSLIFEKFTYSYSSRGRAGDQISAIGKIKSDSLYYGESLVEKIDLVIEKSAENSETTSDFYVFSAETARLSMELPADDFDFLKKNIGLSPVNMTILLQNIYSLYREKREIESAAQLLEGLHTPRRLEWLPFDSINMNNLDGLGRFTIDPISINDLDDKDRARLEEQCVQYPNGGVGKTTYNIVLGPL
jgi:hypothetical protein